MLGYENQPEPNIESNEHISNKRGADEITNSSTPDAGNKRLRTNTNPSKVIHIRNIPIECTEGELNTLCAPFGKVATIHIMNVNGPSKGQALVQMQDQTGATNLVEFYLANPAMLRTNLVHLQYSTREELSAKPPSQNSSASSDQSRGSYQAQSSYQQPGGYTPSMVSHSQPPPPGADANTAEARVLLVNVTNVVYPITIDLLYSVFCKYGVVTKIVTFSKTGVQAFVQFSSSEYAEAAKNALDGQQIYVGSSLLQINYSTIKDLDIKYNNDKSRDFTNPYLPGSTKPEAAPGAMYQPPVQSYDPYAPQMSMYPPPSQQQMSNQRINMNNGGGGGGGANQNVSPVVIVSNLHEEKITPDALFTLFGVYGDVMKVKILYQKKDNALVQMASPQQAVSVITHLKGLELYGKPLSVNFSKHNTIMANKSNDENAQFTKEYVNSSLHRFKNPNNSFKICAPSNTLHVSSIPTTINENELRELFEQYGVVQNVKFFSGEKRMALVQMENLGDAAVALIHLHNHKFADIATPVIRVSFAKSTIYGENDARNIPQ